MNDQVQWSQGWAKLLSVIRTERDDRGLEHKCVDQLRKRGDIR